MYSFDNVLLLGCPSSDPNEQSYWLLRSSQDFLKNCSVTGTRCLAKCGRWWSVCVGFSERLLHQLEGTSERFEVKLMMMDLISRLVGVHQVSQSSPDTCLHFMHTPTPPYTCPVHAHTWGGRKIWKVVNWRKREIIWWKDQQKKRQTSGMRFTPLVRLKLDCGEYEKLASLTAVL